MGVNWSGWPVRGHERGRQSDVVLDGVCADVVLGGARHGAVGRERLHLYGELQSGALLTEGSGPMAHLRARYGYLAVSVLIGVGLGLAVGLVLAGLVVWLWL